MSIRPNTTLPPWADTGDQIQPANADISIGFPHTDVKPTRQTMNWALNYASNGVLYLASRGLPEWDTATAYQAGDVCRSKGKFYSASASNSNKEPSVSPTAWTLLYVFKSDIDPLYLTPAQAAATYLTQASAASTYETIIAANAAHNNLQAQINAIGQPGGGSFVQSDWNATAPNPATILNKPPITYTAGVMTLGATASVVVAPLLRINSPDASQSFSISVDNTGSVNVTGNTIRFVTPSAAFYCPYIVSTGAFQITDTPGTTPATRTHGEIQLQPGSVNSTGWIGFALPNVTWAWIVQASAAHALSWASSFADGTFDITGSDSGLRIISKDTTSLLQVSAAGGADPLLHSSTKRIKTDSALVLPSPIVDHGCIQFGSPPIVSMWAGYPGSLQNFFLNSGIHYDGTDWWASAASGCYMEFGAPPAGLLSFSTVTGLTVGQKATGFVNVFKIDWSGNVDLRGGSLLIESPDFVNHLTINVNSGAGHPTMVSTTGFITITATIVAQGVQSTGGIVSASPDWTRSLTLSTAAGGDPTFNSSTGVIKSNCAITVTSDYRIKRNIESLDAALAVVMELDPVAFDYADSFPSDKQRHLGFIAHDVQRFLPGAVCGEKDAVNKDGDAVLQTIRTDDIVALLTRAVQELSNRVATLEENLSK
jgi:Chaperone of endosialidase